MAIRSLVPAMMTLAAAIVLPCGTASAQPYAKPMAGTSPLVGAISVSGAEPLGPQDFTPVLADYVGQMLDHDQLRQLARDIADLVQARGWPAATATIAPQMLTAGVLHISVDQGRIGAVAINGSAPPAARRLIMALAGQVAHQREVEAVLARVGQIPGVRVTRQRLWRDGDVVRLDVGMAYDRVRVGAAVDNYGTDYLGPVRLAANVQVNDVVTGTDQLGLSGRTNPERPSQLLFGSGWYSMGLGPAGTRAAITGAIGATEPDGTLRDFGFTADSRFAAVAVSHPLALSRRQQVTASAEISYLRLDQNMLDLLVQSDTLVSLSAGVDGRILVGGGQFSFDARVTRGLAMLGATRAGDPLASRRDADGQGTRLNLRAGWRLPLVPRLTLRLDARAQLADGPLLSSEELAIGGGYSVRGYNFSEALGDDGAFGLIELGWSPRQRPQWLGSAEAYVFVDGGLVYDRGGGSDGLASAGGGVRAELGPFALELEAAQPLTGPRRRSGSDAPKVNVQIGLDL